MGNFIDLTGQRFGRLIAMKRHVGLSYGCALWDCRCDCGNTVTVRSGSLRLGNTKSCGCLMLDTSSRIGKESATHGHSKTRLYSVWHDMKLRCYNPKHKYYKYYGGRGISICAQWKSNFTSFEKWALSHGYDATAPRGKCTIDRIDVNGNYCPENCRWVDMKTQRHNQRR